MKQQSSDNDRIEKQFGEVTEPGMVLHQTQCCVPSQAFRSPAVLSPAVCRRSKLPVAF
jgi:hypothetical protein